MNIDRLIGHIEHLLVIHQADRPTRKLNWEVECKYIIASLRLLQTKQDQEAGDIHASIENLHVRNTSYMKADYEAEIENLCDQLRAMTRKYEPEELLGDD